MRVISAVACVLIGVVLTWGALISSGILSKSPVPPALAEAGTWMPKPPKVPESEEIGWLALELVSTANSPGLSSGSPPQAMRLEPALQEFEPPLSTWSRVITPGQTLDTVLAEAGLGEAKRAEVALALGAEYDLRRLRPGHSVTVVSRLDGNPRSVSLAVEDGVRIEAIFDDVIVTRTVEPKPEVVMFAAETTINSSIFAALDEANLPARFAVNLAQMLGGTIDFRRDLTGSENLKLLWSEARVGENRIGQPKLAYASLETKGTIYEVVWPEDGSGQATIYVDGDLLHVFAQPVIGARISSTFGRRRHPVYGNVRMHTGVDFAAKKGTLVRSTAPGRIQFIGWRGGYGRVVEISHGSDTLTRYAHLSAVPEGLANGQRVAAGDVIGQVGASGTATGPNLHYEVLVDGRPTDPLSDDRLATATEQETDGTFELSQLTEARALLTKNLGGETTAETTESL